MSYCRRSLERDVYTATGFRAANDWLFMLNEFADRTSLLLPVNPVSRFCEHAGYAETRNPRAYARSRVLADLRRGTSSWNFDAVTSTQREPIDN